MNGTKRTVELARCEFSRNGDLNNKATDGSVLENYYIETDSNTSYGNTKAKNIEQFKRSVSENGGYYIARYEASNNKNVVQSKSNVAVWNNITQPEAAKVCRNMYQNKGFESDLINSYAWDTALLFIQTFANDRYSGQESLNATLAYTGVRTDGTTDKMCNIFDMASNCSEWTTETYMYYSTNCVSRGGNYTTEYEIAGEHQNYEASKAKNHITFRPILYINNK